jgi:uncharacterized membrane protein/mono/diheme cytochrome c family protein
MLKRWTLGIGLLLWLAWPAAATQVRVPPELVREVFRAHCTECHGPDLARPKGEFGYVLDLDRVAANPDYVLAGQPDRSVLYRQLVAEDPDERMPPPNAKRSGPLTAFEIEAVRLWIAQMQDSPAALPLAAEPPARGVAWWAWPGRWHVVIIHFPVALLLSGLVMELLGRWTGSDSLRLAVLPVVRIGALTGLAAAASGWVAGEFHGYSGQTFVWHRGLGIGSGIGMLALLCATEWRARRGGQAGEVVFLAVLVIMAVAVTATAHLGGTLVHGEGFLARPQR